MAAWDYAVQRLTTDGGEGREGALAEALKSATREGWELVSCFPEDQSQHRSPIHELPAEGSGSNPYDSIWQEPTEVAYLAVFKRAL